MHIQTNGLSQGKIESTSMEKCSNEDALKADTSLDQQLVVVSVGTNPGITVEGSGYVSGSAAGGCLCWNKPRHNRRGKMKPGTPVRPRRGAKFLLFGECRKSARTEYRSRRSNKGEEGSFFLPFQLAQLLAFLLVTFGLSSNCKT